MSSKLGQIIAVRDEACRKSANHKTAELGHCEARGVETMPG